MISETQGSARSRNGFRMVHRTRLNREAFPILFQFNDEQSYTLEFTHKKLRFFKDEGIIVEDPKTITAITHASIGVITSVAHGYSTGDEVLLSDVAGMVELNDTFFFVTKIDADSFSLTDQDGTVIDTSAFTAYSSGGVAERIYEIDTPYDESLDLTKIKVTQNADTMYLDHPYYESRKLTRSGHTSWTLSLYDRTSDPFLDKKAISGITKASPGVVTTATHDYVTGDIIIIEGIVGMTELNSRVYTVNVLSSTTFYLIDLVTGVAVDTSAYTSWSSAGYASLQELLPACPSFYEGRLYHGGMEGNPTQFIGSRSPVPLTGVPRYDDYTAGADPDHAVYYSIADGEVNKIFWLLGTNRLMMAGTFGTEVKITGETTDKPITPSSVNVKAENRLGVEPLIPINKENIVIYVQRGGLTLRTFEYDALNDRFTSTDRNLVSEHLTTSGIKQICWQSGRPDIVWALRNDGVLLGLTFKSKEDVSGWHVHSTGGLLKDKFLGIVTTPRPAAYDQLWAVTEREIDGHTRRFMEFMEDPAVIPEFVDFYTGDENKAEDFARFTLAMQEAQRHYLHLDCAVSYDGTQIGIDANATVTPDALTGDGVTITSDNDVFFLTDVGREIWKKAIDGVGEGRAKILSFVNSKTVICQISDDFDNLNAMAPGDWYLTTASLKGLKYAEGREVGIVTDGGVHPDRTVANGEVDLDYQSAKIHVGFKYSCLLMPMTVEAGGTTGPAQGKNKNVNRVGIRFLNTLGAEYGSDIYDPEQVDFSEMPLVMGGAQLLYSGLKDVHLSDEWSIEKVIFVRQDHPLPCTVQFLELWVESDNIGS